MEYAPVTMPVTYGGAPCGEAVLQRDGLYTTARCRCRFVSQEVLRAYVRCGGQTVCLGVLEPAQGSLCLTRRIPASRLDPDRVGGIYLAGEEAPPAWLPWQGEVDGCALSGLSKTEEDGRQTIAVAYDPSQPLPCLRLYGAMEPMWLDGKLHLTLQL